MNVIPLPKQVHDKAHGNKCQECRLKPLCLGHGLNSGELEQLDGIVRRERVLGRGERLFRQGEQFHTIYAVRSGSFKTYTTSEDGYEQVTGFLLPGQLAGLDAIFPDSHPTTATALETASVCEIPFDRLVETAASIPALQQQFVRILSQQIMTDEEHAVLLGKNCAQTKLAGLLVNFAEQFRSRGYAANEFNLNMSRRDIGNYLGLALETVSRSFSKLQRENVISVDRKLVRIHDLEQLRHRSFELEADEPLRASA